MVSLARLHWGFAYSRIRLISLRGSGYAVETPRLLLRTRSYGLPVARVIFSYHENDKKIVQNAKVKMKEILEAAGREDVWTADRTAHLRGTCRMGNDPGTSVVNVDCQTHDVPNLFVCDGSVFTTSTAVNTSLTHRSDSGSHRRSHLRKATNSLNCVIPPRNPVPNQELRERRPGRTLTTSKSVVSLVRRKIDRLKR
jgi:hypothetical protein